MEQRADDRTDPSEPVATVGRHAPALALVALVGVDVASLIATTGASTTALAGHLPVPVVGGVLLVLLLARRRWAAPVTAPLLATALLVRLVLLAVGTDPAASDPASAAGAAFVLVYVLAFLGHGRVPAAIGSGVVAASAFAVTVLGGAGPAGTTVAALVVTPLQTLALHAAVIGVLLALGRVRPSDGSPTPAVATGATVVSGTDELTGLTSYLPLTAVLERELARAERHLLPLSVILIGLDDLQAVNERHGRDAGDAVLLEVSTVLARVLRSVDTVGRWGGDEFLVIAPTTGSDDALSLAMRCRYKLRHHPMPEVGPITASFGVSTFELGDDVTTLVERATDALADAKAAGRDRVEVASLEQRITDEARRRSDSGT